MLSALIISYDQGPLLGELLASLLRDREQLNRIVIVSTHPKASQLSLSGIEQIFAGDNPGYGAAINRGMAKLSGEHLLLLNDDVVLAPNAISELKQAIDKPGIYQPLILQEDGSVENSGHHLWWDGFNYARARGKKESPSSAPLIFSGAAFALHSSTQAAVGRFAEDLIFYGEEADYALRALRQNHPVHFVPKARIIHKLGGSLGRSGHEKIYLIERNRLLAARHLPLLLRASLPLWTFLRYLLLASSNTSKTGSSLLLGLLSGSYHLLHHQQQPSQVNQKSDRALFKALLHLPPSIKELRHLGASLK
jgi:N-acetylglucosaminyl-diphospho-decaprenol L-rhamnosyltransferase